MRTVFATEQNGFFHSTPPPSRVSTIACLNLVLCCRSNAALFTVTFGKAPICNKQSDLWLVLAVSKGPACQILERSPAETLHAVP